jgi:hypothetical protein
MRDSLPVDIRTVAEGLEFPEGPVALADGSVLLVEIFAGTLAHVPPDDAVTLQADDYSGARIERIDVTLSWTGRLVAVDWPVAGLRLNYTA